ncbi:MAG: hypothetical protein MUO80_08575 [Dehalococcoidia bacterium]|nr:hypothetical protein [Dehalococcoidia bacterium]
MASNYLITSSAALVAITLAIFVFLLPKTVEIHNTRWKSMLNLDMPDNVRNSKRFRTEIFLDDIGMYVLAFASLLLAVYFTAILTNAISAYFGLPATFVLNNPPQIEFLRALKCLFFLLCAMFTVSLLWLTAGGLISKRLPIIFRAYAEMTIDVSRAIGVKQDLLSTARSYLQEDAYNEAILHSATALEYELRKKLNLGPNNSFAAVMSKLIDSDLAWVNPTEINDLIIARNDVAHKKIGSINYGEREAKEVLESVDRILGHLDVLGASTIYE